MIEPKGSFVVWRWLVVLPLLGALVGLVVSLSDAWQGQVYLLIGGVVLLIALLAVSLWFKRIESLLPLIAFVLPIENVPGAERIGYEDFDLITPLVLLAVVYLALIALSTLRLRFRRTPLDLPILLFVAVQLLISVFSPWPATTLVRYLKYSKVFVLYYFFVNYLESHRAILSVVKIYVLSAILVSLYGLAAFAVFVITGQAVWGLIVKWGYLPRIVATMRDQNILAAYLITPLFLLVSALLTARRRIVRWLLLGSLVCAGLTLLLTWSRSGLLGLAVGGVLWAVLNKRLVSKRLATILVFGVVVIGVIGIVATAAGYSPMILVDRLFGRAEGTAESSHMHSVLAKLAWQVFLKHPLGVGRPNLFKYIEAASPDVQWVILQVYGIDSTSKGMPVHSSWLEILTSEGILGFLAFAAIVVSAVRSGVRTIRRLDDERLSRILKSFVAGLVGVLASALFYTFDWMYFFWFIISIIVAISLNAAQSGAQSSAQGGGQVVPERTP